MSFGRLTICLIVLVLAFPWSSPAHAAKDPVAQWCAAGARPIFVVEHEPGQIETFCGPHLIQGRTIRQELPMDAAVGSNGMLFVSYSGTDGGSGASLYIYGGGGKIERIIPNLACSGQVTSDGMGSIYMASAAAYGPCSTKTLFRIDTATYVVKRSPVDFLPLDISGDNQGVYMVGPNQSVRLFTHGGGLAASNDRVATPFAMAATPQVVVVTETYKNTIALLNPSTLRAMQELKGCAFPYSVAIAPNHDIFVGSGRGFICHYTAPRYTLKMYSVVKTPHSLAIFDGALVVGDYSPAGGVLRTFDLKTIRPIAVVPLSGWPQSIAL